MAYIGTGLEAPTLMSVGDKWNNKGTYNKELRPDGYLFGQHPNELRNFIMNELTGQQGNLLKLMLLLIDTDDGFKISEQWVLKSTGLQHAKYIQARAILTEINWLIRDENILGINYTFLWAQINLPKEKRAKTQVRIKDAKNKLGYH